MEVDHRAKNVLAVVDSIVRLSRADDAASYSASVQQRVQALSVAHGLLAEGGWDRIPLLDVVGRQVDRYKARGVDLTGPDIAVSAIIVQSLALVFHELATNAATHGALSKPEGRLSLSWEKTDNQGGFCMTWREFGGTRPEATSRSGFGTVMVKALIERQLSGHVHRDWGDEGLVIGLQVPGGQRG